MKTVNSRIMSFIQGNPKVFLVLLLEDRTISEEKVAEI